MIRKAAVYISSIFLLLVPAGTSLSQEKSYTVDILQITAIEELQQVYEGFLKELEKNGIIQGKNLTVKRTIIDFDLTNASLTNKIKVYFRIKSEASRIAKEKPDLALTMGTPATKYSKDKIIAANVPLVFTALAFPTLLGCKSSTEPCPGLTGVTTYMDMTEAFKVIRQTIPSMKTMGIVHSDDSNSIAHVEEAKKEGQAAGITVISKQVNMRDRITPALQELRKQGAESFAVPPDPYYGLHGHEKASELIDYAKANKLPVFSLVIDRFPGAVMYIGVDFHTIGTLSGKQAVKILKEGVKPDTLPILRQQDLTIIVDTKLMQSLGIQLPPEILHAAGQVE